MGKALSMLIYSHYKTSRDNNVTKTTIYFSLPFNYSLNQMKEDFKGWREFKYLILENIVEDTHKGIDGEYIIAEYRSDQELTKNLRALIRLVRTNVSGTLITFDDELPSRSSASDIISMSDDFRDSIRINELEEIEHNPMPTASLPNVKVLNVGHGLMVIDYVNSFVFDCGGELAKYNDALDELDKLKNIIIVISHYHDDHYIYLYKIINGKSKSGSIEERIYNKISHIYIFSSSGFFSQVDERILKIALSDKKILYLTRKNKTIYDWTLKVTPIPKNPGLNYFSAIAINNTWSVFGDLPWKKIWDLITKLDIKENIVLPHHGSVNKRETGTIGMTIPHKVNIYASASGKYRLPANKSKFSADFINPANTFQITDGKPFKP